MCCYAIGSIPQVSLIALGDTLGGFGLSFDWISMGNPGSQYFEVFDPLTFEVLESGFTSVVPLPSALFLIGSGIVPHVVFRRKSASL